MGSELFNKAREKLRIARTHGTKTSKSQSSEDGPEQASSSRTDQTIHLEQASGSESSDEAYYESMTGDPQAEDTDHEPKPLADTPADWNWRCAHSKPEGSRLESIRHPASWRDLPLKEWGMTMETTTGRHEVGFMLAAMSDTLGEQTLEQRTHYFLDPELPRTVFACRIGNFRQSDVNKPTLDFKPFMFDDPASEPPKKEEPSSLGAMQNSDAISPVVNSIRYDLGEVTETPDSELQGYMTFAMINTTTASVPAVRKIATYSVGPFKRRLLPNESHDTHTLTAYCCASLEACLKRPIEEYHETRGCYVYPVEGLTPQIYHQPSQKLCSKLYTAWNWVLHEIFSTPTATQDRPPNEANLVVSEVPDACPSVPSDYPWEEQQLRWIDGPDKHILAAQALTPEDIWK